MLFCFVFFLPQNQILPNNGLRIHSLLSPKLKDNSTFQLLRKFYISKATGRAALVFRETLLHNFWAKCPIPTVCYCNNLWTEPRFSTWVAIPRDGGAWWAAIYGVAQSRTRLKRLSSSSSQKSR